MKALKIIVIILIFLALVGFGFLIGLYQQSVQKNELHDVRRKAAGYSVLNADSVIMASGDTVRYKWNQHE